MIRSIRLRVVAASAALALAGYGLAPVQTVAAAVPLPLYRIDAIVPTGVATAINELGDFVGWQSLTGSPRAFIHRGGQLTLLPTPSDRPLSVARDLNDSGAVVGYAYKTTIDEPGDAMRWTSGTSGWTFKDLGFLPGDAVSEAEGINERGQIVGRSNPRSFLQEHAFLYTDAAGMSQINAVSNMFVAEDINELGVVVGTGYSTAQRVDVTTGIARDLGVPAPYGYSHAYAVNDSGQVAGALTSATGSSQRVARFADATGWQVLGGLGGGSSIQNIGWGINSAGTVVGSGMPRTGSLPGQRGVIYLDSYGSLLYVDDLLEAGTEWSVYAAYDINDRDQIVGYARNRVSGATAGVRLSPVGTQGVPAAPTGLTATPYAATTSLEQHRIELRWQDNTASETAYELERRRVDAAGSPLTTFARIASLTANVTAYSDLALDPGARYEYRARAVGVAGASAYSNSAFAQAPATTVDRTVPTLTITSPAAGSTVSGKVTVTVSATDNVGIVRVELLVDTSLLGTCALAAGSTYTCKAWDTRKWSDGGWTLYARAWDKAGNLGVAAITVFVSKSRVR